MMQLILIDKVSWYFCHIFHSDWQVNLQSAHDSAQEKI